MSDLESAFQGTEQSFQIYYNRDCLYHEAHYDHPESPERLGAILKGCQDSIAPNCRVRFSSPIALNIADLESVHDADYLLAMESCILSGKSTFMDNDTYICHDSLDAILACAGMSRELAKCLSNQGSGFALTRPPGHHAGRAKAEGFCFINNVAIAAEELRNNHGINKILIVDFDVHHGNGVYSIFREDPEVYYFSLHGNPEHIYPHTGHVSEKGHGEGKGFTKNISLPEGSSGDEWLKAFTCNLSLIEQEFEADAILVSAGFDAHEEDPFSLMKVQDEHYLEACLCLQRLAQRQCGGRIGFFLEGGYSLDVMQRLVPKCIEALAENHSLNL